MATRKKPQPVNAAVQIASAGTHHNLVTVASHENVSLIRVAPSIPQIAYVDIAVDPRNGGVEITVYPADENCPNLPRLAVQPDMSFTARS